MFTSQQRPGIHKGSNYRGSMRTSSIGHGNQNHTAALSITSISPTPISLGSRCGHNHIEFGRIIERDLLCYESVDIADIEHRRGVLASGGFFVYCTLRRGTFGSLPETVAQLVGATGPVHAVTYSSSPGSYVLTGSGDRSVRLYNPSSTVAAPSPAENTISASTRGRTATPPIPQGKLIQTYAAHGYEVLSISVSSDNERFASAGATASCSSGTWRRRRRFGASAAVRRATRRASTASVSAGTRTACSCPGFDTSVRIWDVKAQSPKPIQVLDDARDAVTCLAVRGPEIVAGSVDGRVRAYDIRMGRCTVDTMGASVTGLDITRDGAAMLVGTLDSKLRLMDREKGTCLQTFEGDAWQNKELRVQAVLGGRERFVVAGDELLGADEATLDAGEGRIWAWDLLSGKVVARIQVPWGPGGLQNRKRVVGRDGKEKKQNNIISCLAWKEGGWGNQFCAGESRAR
ncbi:unnamed protein product [Parascedosporium putredinis]|uniref:WD40 repeat-like protein n=1 Tax=Parascedosporium putredinis TaxID=1442378 RepID=A0A9P1GU78_9PEZI|nr:unnamed protein product [Parascedosporium putredinis]CAI7987482.1 unnamed protein product [Parascedosporium putredinis]